MLLYHKRAPRAARSALLSQFIRRVITMSATARDDDDSDIESVSVSSRRDLADQDGDEKDDEKEATSTRSIGLPTPMHTPLVAEHEYRSIIGAVIESSSPDVVIDGMLDRMTRVHATPPDDRTLEHQFEFATNWFHLSKYSLHVSQAFELGARQRAMAADTSNVGGASDYARFMALSESTRYAGRVIVYARDVCGLSNIPDDPLKPIRVFKHGLFIQEQIELAMLGLRRAVGLLYACQTTIWPHVHTYDPAAKAQLSSYYTICRIIGGWCAMYHKLSLQAKRLHNNADDYNLKLDERALGYAHTTYELIKQYQYDTRAPVGLPERWKAVALGIGHACQLEIMVLQARRFFYRNDVDDLRSAAALLKNVQSRFNHVPVPLGEQVLRELTGSGITAYTYDEMIQRNTDPPIPVIYNMLIAGIRPDDKQYNPFKLKSTVAGSRPRRPSVTRSPSQTHHYV